jgi:CubicO group peptidase (beta-lactamase class C family)
MISRRHALAGVVTGAMFSPAIAKVGAFEVDGRPRFSPLGPDAVRYGAAEGYPARRPIEEVGNRVGAFSHFDELYPTRKITRPGTPWHFNRSEAKIEYRFEGRDLSLADYVTRNPVTGLLIARGDDILFEHYNYGRMDTDRLLSRSMAKTVTGLLVGIAISEGAIRSVGDTAETYVPAFRGAEYGRTPIRDLLHMSSGVAFGEEAANGRDLNRLWLDFMGGYLPQYAGMAKGTIGGIIQFNTRIAPPGTRFAYASIEADVLGVVLRNAVGRSASTYLQEKIWQPIGAEADASWLVDADGFEVTHGFLSAVLRDYARLGRLMAHDGAWNGKQVIPADWMIEATTVRATDEYLAPGRADPTFGYGYLLWLLPGPRRQFALFGDYGQRICVDPESRLLLVQTAVEQTSEVWWLWNSLSRLFS